MTLLIAWHVPSQVCDLPFGAVHKVKFGTGGADVGAAARGLYAGACGVKALYACATWEVARVLRPRGRRVHARLAGWSAETCVGDILASDEIAEQAASM